MNRTVPITTLLLALAHFVPSVYGSIEHDHGIDLQLEGADITSNVDVQWEVQDVAGDVITGKLMVTGLSTVMDIDNVPPPTDFRIFPTYAFGPPGGAFTIDITVQVDLVQQSIMATDGTLRIDGYLGDFRDTPPNQPELVPGSGLLLTGDVMNFGFVGNPDTAGAGKFEFIFTPTGGDLANPHPELDNEVFFPTSIGSKVISTTLRNSQEEYIYLTLSSFQNDFHNSQSTSDTGSMVIPEPASLAILLGLLLLLVPLVQRSARHRRRGLPQTHQET